MKGQNRKSGTARHAVKPCPELVNWFYDQSDRGYWFFGWFELSGTCGHRWLHHCNGIQGGDHASAGGGTLSDARFPSSVTTAVVLSAEFLTLLRFNAVQ